MYIFVSDEAKNSGRVSLVLKFLTKRGTERSAQIIRKPALFEYRVKRATAQRYMKVLREAGIAEFTGAPKTGRYVLTKHFRSKLSKDQTSGRNVIRDEYV